MKGKARVAVFSLSAIMAFRMLGLFMILPVFSLHATKMPGASATLVGVALGVYGLTQAALQMPFGMLSDKMGRKPIIVAGLLLFIIGSIFAALSTNIYGLILGRAMQGAGAIGSTTLAFVADLTRDEDRSRSMAVIGLVIGLSFALAMILGPIINHGFGLSGIFWITAGLGAFGIILLLIVVPAPPQPIMHQDVESSPNRVTSVINDPQLLRLDLGIFTLHAILTAMFIVIPLLLAHMHQLVNFEQAWLYLGVLAISFATMVPLIIFAEKRHHLKGVMLGAISTLFFVQLCLLVWHDIIWVIVVLLIFFFAAFTLLEASLPSLTSKLAPIRSKGTAMGIYSTSQFLGIFIGGSLGGWLYNAFNVAGIFIFCATLCLIWLLFAVTMRTPPYLSTLIIAAPSGLADDIDALSLKLRSIPGVAEIAIVPEEDQVYLKVDRKIINEHELRNVIRGGNLS